MNLVIAEKPSVARSIATVIGADEKQNGYWQGGGYLVSWCIGHLVSFAEAGQYDEKYCKWKYEDLPILPQLWKFIVPDEKKQQFEVLRALLNRPDVDSVTAATDAGREGELIFRFVYQLAGCTKPVKRLWISSMEDAAIREGFANLRPDSDYDALYQSALCRAIALSDNSTNVIARYIDEAPTTSTNMDLQLLTEEEVFSTSDMAIFKGIVLEIKNVELDFSGVKEYRAIAQIEVKEVFQGSCKEGETVSVLLPCPISEDIWVEDTDVISAMKSGMTGIFMPVLYNDENSIWKQNNACLVKKDIAEYGLLDGLQYAFLETESGLVFSKGTYESIADVTTLNEVEEYIQTMLQRS